MDKFWEPETLPPFDPERASAVSSLGNAFGLDALQAQRLTDEQQALQQIRDERTNRLLRLRQILGEPHGDKETGLKPEDVKSLKGIGLSKFKDLSRSQKVASVAMALADLGAGFFGGPGTGVSLERTAVRNRRELEDFQKRQMALEQMAGEGDQQDIVGRLGLTRLKSEFEMDRVKADREWAQNLIQATDAVSAYEIWSAYPGNEVEKARKVVDQINSGLDPQSKQMMMGAVLGKLREGGVKYEAELDSLRDQFAKRISAFIDNPNSQQGITNPLLDELDPTNMPGITGALLLRNAKTRQEVIQVGTQLEALASQRAQKARLASGGQDPVLKEQLLAQRALVAEARKEGVDFNAFDPKVYGKELKNVLETDPNTGLLDDDAMFWLQNEVARIKSADRKSMTANVRAFKQGMDSALKSVRELAVDYRQRGLGYEDVEQDVKDKIYSTYGLVGKWASEAERHAAKFLTAIKAAFEVLDDEAAKAEEEKSRREGGFMGVVPGPSHSSNRFDR